MPGVDSDVVVLGIVLIVDVMPGVVSLVVLGIVSVVEVMPGIISGVALGIVPGVVSSSNGGTVLRSVVIFVFGSVLGSLVPLS